MASVLPETGQTFTRVSGLVFVNAPRVLTAPAPPVALVHVFRGVMSLRY